MAGKRNDELSGARQVMEAVKGLLGMAPDFNDKREGGRSFKWLLPNDQNWSGIAQVIEDLLKECGVWADGCIEVKQGRHERDQGALSVHVRVTVYDRPQTRLLKTGGAGQSRSRGAGA
jgi:hypothetical protein